MTDAVPEVRSAPEAQPGDRLAASRAFISSLRKLDTGRRAALRRNAGNSLAEARKVPWFHELLVRYAHGYDDEAFFLVATLFAADKVAISEETEPDGDLGATLHVLRSKSPAPESLDRRFGILLDAELDAGGGGEFAFRLRQMVRLILSKKDHTIRINWPQLLHDAKRWHSERKYIQKEWARNYYAPLTPENNEEPTDSTDPRGDI